MIFSLTSIDFQHHDTSDDARYSSTPDVISLKCTEVRDTWTLLKYFYFHKPFSFTNKSHNIVGQRWTSIACTACILVDLYRSRVSHPWVKCRFTLACLKRRQRQQLILADVLLKKTRRGLIPTSAHCFRMTAQPLFSYVSLMCL